MLLSDNYPVSTWLSGINPRVHSRPVAVFRRACFLEQLETHAEVSVAASRTLRDLTESGNGHRAEHLSLLAKCRDTSRAMDNELLQALRTTVITPLDCEDLKRISARMFRIVNALTGTGYAVIAVTTTEQRLRPVQDRIVAATEALAGAVADLAGERSIERSSRLLWERTREAMVALRQVHGDAINAASDPVRAMAEEAIWRRLAGVLGLLREANRLIAIAKLKAG